MGRTHWISSMMMKWRPQCSATMAATIGIQEGLIFRFDWCHDNASSIYSQTHLTWTWTWCTPNRISRKGETSKVEGWTTWRSRSDAAARNIPPLLKHCLYTFALPNTRSITIMISILTLFTCIHSNQQLNTAIPKLATMELPPRWIRMPSRVMDLIHYSSIRTLGFLLPASVQLQWTVLRRVLLHWGFLQSVTPRKIYRLTNPG